MTLVRFIRRDRKVEAGFRKVVLEVCVRVTVIISGGGGPEKLPCEHSSVTQTKTQPLIQLIFGDEIDLVA